MKGGSPPWPQNFPCQYGPVNLLPFISNIFQTTLSKSVFQDLTIPFPPLFYAQDCYQCHWWPLPLMKSKKLCQPYSQNAGCFKSDHFFPTHCNHLVRAIIISGPNNSRSLLTGTHESAHPLILHIVARVIFFFFFFGSTTPWSLQDLSSPTRDWAWTKQWKHQILTTRPPRSSQSDLFRL